MWMSLVLSSSLFRYDVSTRCVRVELVVRGIGQVAKVTAARAEVL